MINFEKFRLENFKNDTIVTDKKIAKLYAIHGKNVLLVKEGERAKNLKTVEILCKKFLQMGLTKGDKIVAVGGGSIGDIVGLSASIFKRGTKLLHVPTTLLAMIDSSIGGKTAANLNSTKNAVGTIFSADTLIDTNFLHTLTPRHFLDAAGEIEKYRLLDSHIAKVDKTDFNQLVVLCALFKQKIVQADPNDMGIRRQLNMGHTVGHALELQYNLSHGQAVLAGLIAEMQLAKKLGIVSSSFVENWQKSLGEVGKLPKITLQTIKNMTNDKKNADGKICFVLSDGNFGFSTLFKTKAEIEELFLC